MNVESKKLQNNICPICQSSISIKTIKALPALQNPEVIIRADLRQKYKNDDINAQFLLLYDSCVCNNCYYSVLNKDFQLGADVKDCLVENVEIRQNLVRELFEEIQFNQTRTLEHGLLSAILGIECYKFFHKKHNPTFKKAVCALRASWFAKDLFIKTNQKSFQTIHAIFQRKAAKYYTLALEYLQDNTEQFQEDQCIGPDVSQKWGHNGLLYLVGYFNYLQAIHEKDTHKSLETLKKVKEIIATMQSNAKQNYESQLLLKFGKTIKRLSNEKIKTLENNPT